MTGWLESSSVLFPIIGALLALGTGIIYCLFLYSASECLAKVHHDNRTLSPGKVWLNLVPIVGLGWIFVTVARLSESVKQELEDRDPDGPEPDDSGKTLGFLFATGWFFSHVPLIIFGIMFLAGSTFTYELLVALIPAIPTLAVGVLYWNRIVKVAKQLDVQNQEGVFFEKYNARLEFPTSVALSTLGVSLMFAGLLLALVVAYGGQDKKSVPIRLVEGGEDDFGDGSPGSGGVVDPLAKGEQAPNKQDFEALALKDLPEVKEEIRKSIELDDPTGTTPINDEKAAAYATLDKTIRDKLIGQNRGVGGGPGRGDSGQEGAGPGGTGVHSTWARSLRWVLRFRTNSGRDYLDQLMSLKAVVLVPEPPDNKRAHIFRDLQSPKPGTYVTDTEWASLQNQIQFCDFKRDSAEQVGISLGLSFRPTAFWAFFPKGIEDELAKLEVSYRNRRPEDIEETVFQVGVRNGQYQLIVAEQRPKR